MSYRGSALAGLALMCMVAACHNRDAYLLAPDNIDQFLTVTAPQTLRADGVDTAPVEARITERSPGDLNAVFTATGGGTLIGAGTEGPMVTVPFSSQGVAIAQLRSDAQPKHISVQVKIGKVTVTKEVEFVGVTSSKVFTLTADPPELKANGFSRARIDVVLTPVGTTAQRSVVFTTTGGTLFAGATSGTRVDTVANEQGIATAFLESDLTPRLTVVTATARDHSQSITIPFREAASSDLIAIRTSRSVAAADDDELVRVTAVVPRELVTAKRRITIRTTRGQFTNGQTSVEDVAAVNGELSADLKSNSAGVAIVSASVDGGKAETQVRFETAQPTQIVVTAASPTVTAGGTVAIRATLLRASGKVTVGMFPVYSATMSGGGSIGTFTDIRPSDANFVSTADFALPAGSSYHGTITIRVTSSDGLISGTTTVEVP